MISFLTFLGDLHYFWAICMWREHETCDKGLLLFLSKPEQKQLQSERMNHFQRLNKVKELKLSFSCATGENVSRPELCRHGEPGSGNTGTCTAHSDLGLPVWPIWKRIAKSRWTGIEPDPSRGWSCPVITIFLQPTCHGDVVMAMSYQRHCWKAWDFPISALLGGPRFPVFSRLVF